MYIELKCRSCGKAFRVDFTSNEYDVDKCPKCGSYAQKGNIDKLELTLASLRALFLDKVNENHKEMAQILGLAQEG